MANRRLYNGTKRNVVLMASRPGKDPKEKIDVKIVVPAHPGSVVLNEMQYKVLDKSGLFKAMKDRGQISFNPVMLSESNQKTSFKEAPQNLRPPEDKKVNKKITQEVKRG